MKKLFLFILLSLFLFSCGTSENKDNQAKSPSSDSIVADSFRLFTGHFIDDLWKLYPGWASNQGFHMYDSVLVVPDSLFHANEVIFAEAKLSGLHSFEKERLSPSDRTDYLILENLLHNLVFNATEFKEYEWNPAYYNVSGSFAEILQSRQSSLENRMRMLNQRLSAVPRYYSNASKMIRKPTIEHTELAIKQNEGGMDVFNGMLRDSLKVCQLDVSEKKEMDQRITVALSAMKGYVDWLKAERKTLTPENSRSFRIGKELYEKKFGYDIVSTYTAEEIYQIALKRKAEIQEEMLGITKQIFHKYLPNVRLSGFTLEQVRMLIDEISKKHVKKEDFQSEIEKQIPILTAFVDQKKLLYLDPSKPLVVRKEPEYMAGVAGASISAPGPYDKEGNTYYNVGSLAGYTPEEAESYLREYNHYILQILNIHEAIPGHYAQLVYSNQSPSLIKSLFGNGAMVEGWAVYAERMMLENGYGAGPDSLEMRLMYDKWHLRSVCNTILDYSVHVLGMTKEEAINLLVNEAFQQEQEAVNKWKRVTLTQVQLDSYFTGYTEIYALREQIIIKQGEKFNIKRFNEKLLSFGSTPVKYIKDLMLENN